MNSEHSVVGGGEGCGEAKIFSFRKKKKKKTQNKKPNKTQVMLLDFFSLVKDR